MKTALVEIKYMAQAYPEGAKLKVGKGQEEREVDVTGEEIKDGNYIGPWDEKEFTVTERITRIKILDRARLTDKMSADMKAGKPTEAMIFFNVSLVAVCIINEDGSHKYSTKQLLDFETEKQIAYKKAVDDHNNTPDAVDVGNVS